MSTVEMPLAPRLKPVKQPKPLTLTLPLHTVIFTIGTSMAGKTHFCKNTLVPLLNQKLVDAQVPEPKVAYLSSDDFRRQMLMHLVSSASDDSRFDQRMLEISPNAFEVLRTTLRQMLAFPVAAHFVVVDTTGLSVAFHEEMARLVHEYHYSTAALVWDFRKSSDFFVHTESMPGGTHTVRKLIAHQMHRLHAYLLPNLGKLYPKNRYTLSQHNMATHLTIPDLALYRSCFLDPSHSYFVIGDVHECLDELRSLLTQAGYKIDPTTDLIEHGSTTARYKTDIVFVGDIVDKGGRTREMIEFIHKNFFRGQQTQTEREKAFSREEIEIVVTGAVVVAPPPTTFPLLFIVRGNHERVNADLLTDEATAMKQYGNEAIEKYFSAHATLKNDLALAKQFMDLYAATRPFYAFLSADAYSRSFIVTHSPCKTMFLGKVDDTSQRRQQYTHFDREQPFAPQLAKLVSNDMSGAPFHVTGHMNLADVYLGYKRDKNYFLGVDSGCVAGYSLSGVVVGRHYLRPEVVQVKATSHARCESNVLYSIETLISALPDKAPITKNDDATTTVTETSVVPVKVLDELDLRQQRTVRGMLRNGVNFISGTVCPAAKDMSKQELESLDKALEYYWKQVPEGKVVLQTKYMGSRLQYYFFVDAPERCYGVSRGGFRKTFPEHIQRQLYELVSAKVSPWARASGVDFVLLDGELLPWSAMGEGLIQEHFGIAGIAEQNELDTLESSGFDKLIQEQLALFEAAKEDKTRILSQAESTTRKELHALMHTDFAVPIAEKQLALQVYHKQVELYGQPMPLNAAGETCIEYKMFSILKYRYAEKDGTVAREVIPALAGESEIEIFERVNTDDRLVLDFSKQTLAEATKEAHVFFARLTTSDGKEGVVVKPQFYRASMAPYLKVRNLDYLSLIYSYNYRMSHKFDKLIKQKNIERKLKASIREYSQGLEMLKTPVHHLTELNAQHAYLIASFLFGTEACTDKEKIDPRL